MPYFRVVLTYKCPKRHANRVERFYQEGDQQAVLERIKRDKLFCYGCEPPKRINHPTRVPVSSISIPLGFPEFPKLAQDARIGADCSWKIDKAKKKRK